MTMGCRTETGDAAAGRHPRFRASAFTLLELIIALAIFLLLVASLVGFSREVTKSWGRLHTEQRRFQELMVLDRTLDGILTNVVPFVWRDLDNQALPAFHGESDRLIVACLRTCEDPHAGAIRFVGLAVDGDSRLLAVYQHRPLLDWDSESELAQTSVIAENVEEIRFYYAKGLEEGELEWLETWDNETDGFPLAILIQVSWQDGREESWLRRTSGNGFRERWGKWDPNALDKSPQG